MNTTKPSHSSSKPPAKSRGKKALPDIENEAARKKKLMDSLTAPAFDVYAGMRDWANFYPDASMIDGTRTTMARVVSRCRRADRTEVGPLREVSGANVMGRKKADHGFVEKRRRRRRKKKRKVRKENGERDNGEEWEEVFDVGSGDVYYCNRMTGEASWHPPSGWMFATPEEEKDDGGGGGDVEKNVARVKTLNFMPVTTVVRKIMSEKQLQEIEVMRVKQIAINTAKARRLLRVLEGDD